MLHLAELINSAPLGDPRRNARALTLTNAMLQGQMSGTHGVPGAGGAMPWADTIGAFRFFNNDKLSIPALFEPCRQGLAQLLAPQARALVIHDVSVVDYSTHQAKHDLVPVGDGR
ncbi:MAG TPA: transposase DNA-binding-containing protein [Pseudomonadota bacterium]|nr:transposase DNA-binding-containing protein [Pseudomonadota bacterium]